MLAPSSFLRGSLSKKLMNKVQFQRANPLALCSTFVVHISSPGNRGSAASRHKKGVLKTLFGESVAVR